MIRFVVFSVFSFLLLLATTAAAQKDDKVDKLIQILKKKGITFTREELAELADAAPVKKTGEPVTSTELEAAIDEALKERQAELGGVVKLPGIKSLKITGQNRIRGESNRGIYSPSNTTGQENFYLARMRNRLRFDFEVNDHVEAVFEIQDVRVWGQEGKTTGYNANGTGVELKRGEVIFKDLFDTPLDVEAGRFVMQYGDQRLIGHLEWVDQGRTYDGVRASYNEETYFIDAFGFRERQGSTNPPPGFSNMEDRDAYGIYGGTRDKNCPLNFEAYGIVLRDTNKLMGETSVDDTLFATVGGRIFGKVEGFEYAVEAAYQFGDINDDDLSAWAFAARASYTFDADGKPRIGIEVDHASGDDDPTDGDQGTFQTLFPTNHLYYGYMDIMAWMNMWDVRVSGAIGLCENVTLGLDYHHLRVAETKGGWYNAGGGQIRGAAGAGSGHHLGDEWDLTVTYKPWKQVSFLLGVSQFFDGEYVRNTGGGGDANFAYLQSLVKF